MTQSACGYRSLILAATLTLMISVLPRRADSQGTSSGSTAVLGKDSVVIAAGDEYAAGSFHQTMLGANHRDVWITPIKVPILDLHTFAGGLKPLKKGGGQQTLSLRFVTDDSTEWVFRSVHKVFNVLPKLYKGTVVWYIFRDEGSASHPTGGLAADPIFSAANVLHPSPRLAVMPDDPILGEFRKEFAGMLGDIEPYPNVPPKAPGFANAVDIIDSEKLLEKMNANSDDQIDARVFLTARLIDMFLGDNDRHPGQWKWARLEKKSKGPWEPITTDRDKVFVSYEGLVNKITRMALPNLITFTGTYPNLAGQFANAQEFDRRQTQGLDRQVWDSVARSLQQTLSNSLIEQGVNAMPKEYAPSSRVTAQKLEMRRDHLNEAADRYYDLLWPVADIHATDTTDRANVVRNADGSVEVRLQSGNDKPWLVRRFDPRDTHEIRIYLHGGDDAAVVTGSAQNSIPVRIVGGNGNNILVDSSVVGGHRNPTRLYDVGSVSGAKYAPDTADVRRNVDDAMNHSFNRRPWVRAYGTLIPPTKDRGSSLTPTAGIGTGHGLGVIARLGVAHYTYGFRSVPYASMWRVNAAYSTKKRYALNVATDKRFESTSFHIPIEAGLTQLETVQFRGFGNDILIARAPVPVGLPDPRDPFYDVKQTQYSIHPAIGLALNSGSDISFGPIVRYAVTDSINNKFISQDKPYGFPHFGEAGLQLKLHYDSRSYPDTAHPRAVVEITGSGYPAIWDTKSAYESLAGFAAAYVTIPALTKPVIALRGGGKKLFGDFPYFDGAFLGGSSSLRTEDRQRFAGDASVYGNAELRVPVAKFPFILPLDVGLLGFTDTGRVYVDGDSPGGWHTTSGGGFWVGVINPAISLNVLFTNRQDKRTQANLGFAF